MRHNECEEYSSLADGPWLVAIRSIVGVQSYHTRSVCAGNRDWNFDIENGIVVL